MSDDGQTGDDKGFLARWSQRKHEAKRDGAAPVAESAVPAEPAVRTPLARKLLGKARTSHVMDLVAGEGIAVFAGLNVVPKRSYPAAYSSQVDDRTNAALMAARFREVEQIKHIRQPIA